MNGIPNLPALGTIYAALCWYNFTHDASVLATHGCIEGTDKYDYIICTDPEHSGAELFKNLAERLNPDGRLLVALDNKYGLKYWCGARGGEHKRPFGEIEGGGTMPSGAKLRSELQKAGFVTQKWYYPIPDHRYPRAVYSENKLPNRFFSNVSPAQLIDGTGVLLRESEIMPGVIENGMFTFMCDSFIVEAALQKNAKMCPVDFAALTLYRQPERAFITAVFSDGTATKTAVHPEGVKSLRKLAENHERLIKRGLEAVPMTHDGNSVKMPAISHETLWDYMQKKARNDEFDRTEFIKIFDRLRDDIIKSSKNSPPGSHGWDLAFGSVLDYAYTEMIPANCFYDTARDTFIYFDQEHALKKTPYSVPFSRALMSITYSAELRENPEVRALFAELKSRYGLAEVWDRLLKIEEKFITELTNSTDTALKYNSAAGRANAEITENRRAHDSRAAALILLRKYKKIGIYGFGKNGKALSAALETLGTPSAFTADKKTGGLPKGTRADVIVVTPQKNADKIAAGLQSMTDIPVITLDEVFKNGR